MRYAVSEKPEIIRLVEKSHQSARQSLAKLGIPRTIFCRWYDRYLQRGAAGLQDKSPKPKHDWSRTPDKVYATQLMDVSGEMMGPTVKIQEKAGYGDATPLKKQWSLQPQVMLSVREHLR